MAPVSDARLGKGLLAGHTNDWSDAVTAYAKHLTGHVEVRPDRLEAIALEEAHVGVEVVEHGSVSGHCKQLRGREAMKKSDAGQSSPWTREDASAVLQQQLLRTAQSHQTCTRDGESRIIHTLLKLRASLSQASPTGCD
jgi:hypothetical protein